MIWVMGKLFSSSRIQMFGAPAKMRKRPYGILCVRSLRSQQVADLCSHQHKSFLNSFCCHLHWFQGSKCRHPARLTGTQAYVGGPLAISCITNLQPFRFLWIHTWEKLLRREWDRIFHLCGEPNYFSFNRLTLDFIHFRSKRILILLHVLSHEFRAAI